MNTIECPICIEEIELPISKDGIRLLCSHVFHEKCIREWFTRIGNATCPMCRRHESQIDGYKDLIRRILIRWGMKNLKKEIKNKNFEIVWQWLMTEKRVSIDYRDIIFLISVNKLDSLNKEASEILDLLTTQNYFKYESGSHRYVP